MNELVLNNGYVCYIYNTTELFVIIKHSVIDNTAACLYSDEAVMKMKQKSHATQGIWISEFLWKYTIHKYH